MLKTVRKCWRSDLDRWWGEVFVVRKRGATCFVLYRRAEAPGFDGDLARAEVSGDRFVERDGQFRPRGLDERGAVSLARVAVERELRHQQHRAAYILDAEIKLAVGVVEDAQLRDFLRDGFGVWLCVVCAYTEKYEQPAVDAADRFAIDHD